MCNLVMNDGRVGCGGNAYIFKGNCRMKYLCFGGVGVLGNIGNIGAVAPFGSNYILAFGYQLA